MENDGSPILNNVTRCHHNYYIAWWPNNCAPSGIDMVTESVVANAGLVSREGHNRANLQENMSWPWQSERRRETRKIRPSAVSSIVRYLMAAERARLLGSGTANLSFYARGKRIQRWRESSKVFK